MAAAGFYPVQPLPEAVSSADSAWSCCTSVPALVPGVSRLADELASLCNWTDVAGSIVATMPSCVWNSTAFAPQRRQMMPGHSLLKALRSASS